jgi:Flp pilus assembly protein CpaB
MQTRAIVIVGLIESILAGVGCTSRLAPGPVVMIQVPVAKHELRPGTIIDKPENLFELKEFREETVIPEAITMLEDLRGKILARTVDEGMPCLKRDLTVNEEPKELPEGYRATTIRVAPDGFTGVRPGSWVDVLVTWKTKDNPSQTSKLAIQNVQALALNTEERQGDSGREMVAVATLAVRPADAEKINWVNSTAQRT